MQVAAGSCRDMHEEGLQGLVGPCCADYSYPTPHRQRGLVGLWWADNSYHT